MEQIDMYAESESPAELREKLYAISKRLIELAPSAMNDLEVLMHRLRTERVVELHARRTLNLKARA